MKNNTIILLCLCLILFCQELHAGRDVTQLHLKPGGNTWSIGAGLRTGTFAYIGEDKYQDFLPLIIYNGDEFFIDGTRTGFHLVNNDKWLVSAFAAYRFAGFNEEDSELLDGLDRNDAIDGRIAATYNTDYGNFTLDFGHDISNTHKGWDSQLRWSKRFEYHNLLMRPWLGISYQNQSLTNYYYGVATDEAQLDRPSYSTSSAIEWQYGLDFSYHFAKHDYLALNFQYSELDKTKINSPIVADEGQFETFLTYRYEFNDYQYDENTNSSLLKGLTQGEWYWRVAHGRFTTAKFNELMRFKNMFDPEPRNTGLTSLFVGKKIADSFLGLPLDSYVTLGYARHFEKGYQDNFNEYVLGFKAYFTKFPWSHIVKTRVGIAEGVSYARRVPIVEQENVDRKNRSASKFLNYLDWSWDFSLGDAIGNKSLKDCFLGWSVHHRSGIFSSADLFGNVSGGSNVNTIYIQCHTNNG
ncbi:MipA/OmpV family protein [Thalassotalea sp. LPB0316]|uniref:MipA/OmpV family protein n=1 Tax=Thalassotalea sp. LPB0316 TaxID=2769490 RepID=UPI001867319D|nr:MipA/OmpV family protein [Thalassotalea sp. LPB0316]QOL25402.1 MipA/OmpV family protein [Thalassotalea sp. LPB0316]